MELKDYYQVLNVSQAANAEDIKKAFRRLAVQYHPDHNSENIREAGEKFKEINEAYEILGDKRKRWQYDRIISFSSYLRRAMTEDVSDENMKTENLQEIERILAGMGMVEGMGWGKAGGCGGRQGGRCRRHWSQDIG